MGEHGKNYTNFLSPEGGVENMFNDDYRLDDLSVIRAEYIKESNEIIRKYNEVTDELKNNVDRLNRSQSELDGNGFSH